MSFVVYPEAQRGNPTSTKECVGAYAQSGMNARVLCPSTSAPLAKSHSLFNPAHPVAGLPCDFYTLSSCSHRRKHSNPCHPGRPRSAGGRTYAPNKCAEGAQTRAQRGSEPAFFQNRKSQPVQSGPAGGGWLAAFRSRAISRSRRSPDCPRRDKALSRVTGSKISASRSGRLAAQRLDAIAQIA
jgi:hypothetical protein